MTMPKNLEEGDRVICTNGGRIGTITEIGNPRGGPPRPQYHLKSDDGWSWWSWRENIRKLPDSKEG